MSVSENKISLMQKTKKDEACEEMKPKTPHKTSSLSKVMKLFVMYIFVELINNSLRKHKRNHQREGVDTKIMLIYMKHYV
jgi:hypothetical protein